MVDRGERGVVNDTLVDVTATFVDDINTLEFPILGDNVSPVTFDDHPSMRPYYHRFSVCGGSNRKLEHSPLSQTQSSSSTTASRASLSDRLTMMNITTQELRGAVFYGWLWKRGHSFKTWKTRFFLLNGAALTYYSQCCVIASDVLGGGTQCLDLPVRGGLRVAKAEVSNLTTYGLRITSTSGRVLHAQAGDQFSRKQWLKVLNEASLMTGACRETMISNLSTRRLSKLDGTVPNMHTSLSVLSSEDDDELHECDMQGYLHTQGGLFSSWRKRFLKLKHGQLTIRRNRTLRHSDLLEADKPLQVISAVRWNGHVNGLCIRFENRKELYVYADKDADAALWLDALRSY